jgi:hypothetical protein
MSTVGGATPYFPASATAIEAVSSDANDTIAGTGARTLIVEGLDSDWKRTQASVDLSGLSAASISGTWWRIDRAYVTSVGTNHGSNIGIITVRVASAGASFVNIPAGEGQTLHGAYTTGAGDTLYLEDIHLFVDNIKPINFQLDAAYNVNVANADAVRVFKKYTGASGATDISYPNYVVIPPYTDLWMVGTATGGGGAASIEGVGFVGNG